MELNTMFKIGDLVSSFHTAYTFMPGVGEVVGISLLGMLKDGKPQYLYICECNGKKYHYLEHEIYEYELY